jgi:hypothetical protein
VFREGGNNRIGAVVLLAGGLLAQHRYTPGDVQDGEPLFLANPAVTRHRKTSA